MRYRLIGDNDYLIKPLETILHNRGIEDIQSFLNVSKDNVIDYHKLRNIEKGVEVLLKHLDLGSKIQIIIDSDCDGVNSGAIMYNYIKCIYPDSNIVYSLHSGKEHGISKDIKIEDNVKLLIVPDAGSNQYDEHKVLWQKGVEILVIDHHLAEYESNFAIVINNQLSPEYPNKALTGAGMVYKFCKAVDDKLNASFADQYLDLVALGDIGDMADARDLETRYYILKGLSQIKNPFIKALVDKQSFSLNGKLNIIGVAFYIAPLINAMIRVGTQEEKENMFKAMIESNETRTYQGRTVKGVKPEPVEEPIAVFSARQCVNAKSRQDKLRDKGVQLIEERILEKSLDKNKVLIVDCSNILDNNLTGLVANQLAQKYKKPTLLIREGKNEFYGGSGRGYDKGEIKDFRSILLSLNCFESAEGHAQAFGIKVTGENLIKANDKLNELLKDVKNDNVYEVDLVVPYKHLTVNFMKEVTNLGDIWGCGVHEPYIAFTDITVNTKDIQLIGKNRNTLKFAVKDIEFVKFGSSEEEYQRIIHNTQKALLSINCIGKCAVNEWNGRKKYQVKITDIETKLNREALF